MIIRQEIQEINEFHILYIGYPRKRIMWTQLESTRNSQQRSFSLIAVAAAEDADRDDGPDDYVHSAGDTYRGVSRPLGSVI